MGRPFAVIGFTMFASLFFICALGIWAAVILAVAAVALLIIFICIKKLRQHKAFILAACAVMFSAALFIFQYASSWLPVERYLEKESILSGTVCDYPDFSYEHYYYEIMIDTINEKPLKHSFKIRASGNELLECDVADRVYFRATLNRLDSRGRITQLNYASKGIYAGVFLPENVKIEENKSTWKGFNYYFAQYRYALANSLKNILPADNASLSAAVLTGDKSYMRSDILEQINNAGISHIICVSGLHLSIIGFAVIRLFKRFRFPRFLRYSLAATVIIFFMALCGFTTSVVRAGIMFLIYILAEILLAEPDSKNSLGLATMVILLNPFNAFHIGFIFSFCATLSIITAGNKTVEYFKERLKITDRAWIAQKLFSLFEILLISFCVNLFCLPMSILIFGRINLIGLITNVFVLPFASALLISGGICALSGLLPQNLFGLITNPFAFVNSFLSGYILKMVSFFNRLSFAVLPARGLWIYMSVAVVLLLLAVGFLLIKSRCFKRGFAAVCVVLFITGFIGEGVWQKKRCEITAYSGGYGMCVSVNAGGELILIDSGASNRTNEKTMDAVFYSKNRRIDYFLLSSHVRSSGGNALRLLREVPVEQVITSKTNELIPLLKENKIHLVSENDYQFETKNGVRLRFYSKHGTVIHILYQGVGVLISNSSKVNFSGLPAPMREFSYLIIKGKTQQTLVKKSLNGIIELTASPSKTAQAFGNVYSTGYKKDIKIIITSKTNTIGSVNQWQQ